jgi:hypothetical protein
MVVDPRGDLQLYNGTFYPYVTTFRPSDGASRHRTFPGLSTVNNGTYGSVAAWGPYLFASDMATGYAEDLAYGIVRFNIDDGTAKRFGNGSTFRGVPVEYINLTLGHDGLLYGLALAGQGSEGALIRAFEPATMTQVKEVIPEVLLRGIAVNQAGEIFGTSWVTGHVFKLSPDGDVANGYAVGRPRPRPRRPDHCGWGLRRTVFHRPQSHVVPTPGLPRSRPGLCRL